MLKFEENYFQGEWREGFYVEPMMKRAWAAQLVILSEIDRVCRRHNIKYFADWGTLLGAVRHNGFIPWDDDIDIAMLREDYEQFIWLAKDELPNTYRIMDARLEENPTECHRVTNGKETVIEQRIEKYYGCPYIVGVDIFPYDYVPVQKEEEDIWREMGLILRAILQVIEAQDQIDDEAELRIQRENLLNEMEQLYQIKLDRKKPLRNQVLRLYDRVSALYKRDEGNYITHLHFLARHPEFHLKKEWYDETVLLPFENFMIPVPKYYDEVLTAMYGNYKIPVRGIQDHDYPFYKKQQEAIKLLYGERVGFME